MRQRGPDAPPGSGRICPMSLDVMKERSSRVTRIGEHAGSDAEHTRINPVTARTIAKPDLPKSKIPRESSRRPEPGVWGTLGVAKPNRKRQKENPPNTNNNMSASTCTGAAA